MNPHFLLEKEGMQSDGDLLQHCHLSYSQTGSKVDPSLGRRKEYSPVTTGNWVITDGCGSPGGLEYWVVSMATIWPGYNIERGPFCGLAAVNGYGSH